MTKQQTTTTTTTQDPLRDTAKLVDAATKQAQKLLDEHKRGKGETMSAMEFCRLVLDEGFGLKDWAVGQRQRIVISKARKETLGKSDRKIIKAPSRAPPSVDLPSSRKVWELLSKELSSNKGDNNKIGTIESALDTTTLKEKGIVTVPEILSEKDVLEILEYLSEMEEGRKLDWTFLRPTTGNGQHGAYFTLRNMPECLVNLQNEIQKALKSNLGVESGTKPILLKYGVGGVNWAHQDQSAYPYQATVLLSRPNIDYNGGKFYVCDPSSKDRQKEKPIYNEADLKSSGDVVIFAANDTNPSVQPFYHGMTQVLPGDKGEDESHRLAIGFLQT